MAEGADGNPVAAVARAAGAASGGVSRAGLIGISLGVVAAGAAAGVAIERLTVGREMRRRAREELDAAAPYGSLRGRPRTVTAPDGTELYVELDGTGWDATVSGPSGQDAQLGQPEDEGQRRRAWFTRRRGTASADRPDRTGLPGLLGGTGALARAGRPAKAAPADTPPPLTVVFCHGYCLNQDSWHFQRAAFREGLRLVFWDQRSHGRSERSRSYLAGEPASIDQLGGDLKAVLDAVVPEGPIVLVGHSMGGMTVMALADQHPDLFRERVAGVGLVGTLAGDWDSVTLGLPAAGARLLRKLAPATVKLLGRQVELVEATRRIGADVAAVFYRRFSFGSKDVDPQVVRFAEQLLDATPIDVVAEFYPAFGLHDKKAALAALDGIPVLVLAGTEDLLTPPAHSEEIARALPGAELVVLPETGHLLMLERPDEVDRHLTGLLQRAAGHAGVPAPPDPGTHP
ncbi:alpha/beta fold hydrolase [Kitasatospora sp. DSM 101779]|uniref:alpha/beta fold hydrolase n=1 Tax=Kitasatospora sp. DSM 101779 TaxID=2853165 RepID=UPI0021D88384|nr:alpha/beta hydrolase [Kitasatospora sp. DSM 101779]MCU7824331.1 alpha/beta hydrolase [Kitasatospora sp. DSM 101779]